MLRVSVDASEARAGPPTGGILDTAAEAADLPVGSRDAGSSRVLVGVAQRAREWIIGAAGFALFIALWQLLYLSGLVRGGLLPSPFEVFAQLGRMFAQQSFLDDVVASTRRVLLGVLIGVALAVPVGFLIGWYRSVRALLDPLLSFFRALPPIALIPLVIVYFGIGEFARTSVLAYASFFASVVVIYEGIVALDPIYLRAAMALGANDRELFLRVVLPASVPQILVAFRVALGVSWATVVAAELVAAQQGLGAVIQNAGNFFQISTIYGGILMIGATALLMDQVVRVAFGYLVRWQERIGR